MAQRVRVLVDVQPLMLASSLVRVLDSGDFEITLADEPTILRDDRDFDVVLTDDRVSAIQHARYTIRVDPEDSAETLAEINALLSWLACHSRSSPGHPAA